jgi:3-hydroxybutyryl-CoA dehydratase
MADSRFQIGQRASFARTVTGSGVTTFARLSGDFRPIHVAAEYARESPFGQRVAHGMFLYSVGCSMLEALLPGPGTRQVEKELVFLGATPTGEEVEIGVEGTEPQRHGNNCMRRMRERG